MSGGFVIEPLDAHERTGFDCGSTALDRPLKQRATRGAKRLVASCFMLVETATGAVAGYCTLSAFSVPASELPLDVLKQLPRYPVLPAALIGRLAVNRRFQRRGLAAALLADAATRVLRGDVTAFAIIGDAKDEDAVAFYPPHGFRPFASRAMSLFLPLGSGKKAAS